MQYASSATTCLNQVNSLLKTLLPQWEGITVLDIGGGKFNTHQLYAEKFGVKLYVYDKFNRTEAENREALACRPHVILCSNVLNVIDEGQALRDVILTKSPVIFSFMRAINLELEKLPKKIVGNVIGRPKNISQS